MKYPSSLDRRLRVAVSLTLLAGAIFTASLGLVAGADAKTDKQAKSDRSTQTESKTGKKPAKQKLTGSELYAIHCGRCHPERYPTEFTAAQWKTIMLEMRVRANLPADQAKAILKYLQEDSGTP